MSEFSLLVVFVATTHGLISQDASLMVQIATLISFVVSAWYIVMRYPTPIALDEKLRRD